MNYLFLFIDKYVCVLVYVCTHVRAAREEHQNPWSYRQL